MCVCSHEFCSLVVLVLLQAAVHVWWVCLVPCSCPLHHKHVDVVCSVDKFVVFSFYPRLQWPGVSILPWFTLPLPPYLSFFSCLGGPTPWRQLRVWEIYKSQGIDPQNVGAITHPTWNVGLIRTPTVAATLTPSRPLGRPALLKWWICVWEMTQLCWGRGVARGGQLPPRPNRRRSIFFRALILAHQRSASVAPNVTPLCWGADTATHLLWSY